MIARLVRFVLRPLIFVGIKLKRNREPSVNRYTRFVDQLQVGDIIVVGKKRRFSNLFIPGKFTHAAIYIGDDIIVEAVYPKVRASSVMLLLFANDRATILRAPDANQGYAKKYAVNTIGVRYDTEFDENNRKLYCSELCAAAIAIATGGRVWFQLRRRFGVYTITPQDLYDAHNKLQKVATL